jgi:Flp pilus assembly protein TadD
VLLGIALGLSFGLAAGYHLGRQSAGPAAAAAPAASGAPISTVNELAAREVALKALLAANPSDSESLVKLGNHYYDSGRFADAADWYGRALELRPRDVDVRTDRGTSLWNLGRADEAIVEFQKSLEVDASHPQTLYNLGVVYLHGKNAPEAARSAWERLLAAHPDYPERAKLETQLASLGGAAQPGASAGARSGGVEDLLERMRRQP